MEEFRPIQEFPGYEVSNVGRVKSNKRKRSIILKPVINRNGYPQVHLKGAGKVRTRAIHRLVLETFVGLPGPGLECAHLDGNPANNNLENLKWVTHAENMQHKKIHGTDVVAKGSEHPRALLTEEQVLDIKYKILNNEYPSDIAKSFGVTVGLVYQIAYNNSWKHVGPVLPGYAHKMQHKPAGDLEQVVKDIDSGMTVQQVASKRGVHFSSVARAYRRKTGRGVRESRQS